MNALRVIAPELPFPIIFKEITQNEQDFEVKGYHIHAFRVQHNVTCYGYTIQIPRAGRFMLKGKRAWHSAYLLESFAKGRDNDRWR